MLALRSCYEDYFDFTLIQISLQIQGQEQRLLQGSGVGDQRLGRCDIAYVSILSVGISTSDFGPPDHRTSIMPHCKTAACLHSQTDIVITIDLIRLLSYNVYIYRKGLF